jgi:hypothetical protein
MAGGRAKIYGGSPQFWLWTLLTLSTFAVVYWKYALGLLESQKSAVMAKQRAVAQTLGPKIAPFRDHLEGWVTELSRDPQPNLIADGVALDTIANGPGVYLRLRLVNTKDVPSLRGAAARSLRDGFTSCLFVRHEDTQGTACKSPADCSGGLLCNDWSVCARPSQPYNLRLAYRTLRILSPEWTDELHQASTDLAVRAFELDLDAVTRNDVPVAVEVLSRARYFTAVLDEDPPGGLPPGLEHPKGQRDESAEERVQRSPHTARVGIWDVRAERLLVRIRADAAGAFVAVGDRAAISADTAAAQQRQVNSCALALEVKEAIGAVQTPPARPGP